MPIYTFICSGCGYQEEQLLKYQERDTPFTCPSCGDPMNRRGGEITHIGKESYQMKAVLGTGEHVKGHFGKDAKRGRK
jgi:putative FmdB family regulatory protein